MQEFLGLSDHQVWLIDLKIDLGEAVRARRTARSWTREHLAEKLGLSPQKITDLEAGGTAVFVDEQLVALKTLEITRTQLREVLEMEFEDEIAREEELVTA